MERSGIVVDNDYLKHDPGAGHPERPERIQVLLKLAEQLDSARFEILSPRPASRAEIELCHSPEYVDLIASTSRTAQFALDGDTIASRDSFAVSLLACGGFLRLLEAIAAGECRNGFALVRPPGHHALKSRAMGFCLFNNVAIGAQFLKQRFQARRVLIVDWDVHHGNGTQDAFYHDPSVFFISIHQYPFYPGTGGIEEVGVGPGACSTLNIPLPAGCGDAEYLRVFHDLVLPAARSFAPEWVLVSAGFDPHRRDPLAGMAVTEEGFARMAESLRRLADEVADGKLAFSLEGGYDLPALKNSVAAVLERLQTPRPEGDPLPRPGGDRVETIVRHVRQVRERCQPKSA